MNGDRSPKGLTDNQRDRLSLYHDGDPSLRPADRSEIAAWVERDPVAAAYLRDLRTVDAALGSLATPISANHDAARARFLEAGIPIGESQPVSRGRIVFLRRWIGWTAGVAAMLAVVISIVINQPATSSTDGPVANNGAGQTPGEVVTPEGDAPPSTEMLALLDLLESDVPLADLASLEAQDMALVGDVVYQDVLTAYDGWSDTSEND